jgi:hypothetical protein
MLRPASPTSPWKTPQPATPRLAPPNVARRKRSLDFLRVVWVASVVFAHDGAPCQLDCNGHRKPSQRPQTLRDDGIVRRKNDGSGSVPPEYPAWPRLNPWVQQIPRTNQFRLRVAHPHARHLPRGSPMVEPLIHFPVLQRQGYGQSGRALRSLCRRYGIPVVRLNKRQYALRHADYELLLVRMSVDVRRAA